MTTVTLRGTKGSPLTNAEVDANFDNLNSYKVERSSTTGSAYLPSGTTAQRTGSSVAGEVRYNTSTQKFEGYGSAWGNLGGGAAIGDTAPSNPGTGDLWWNSLDGHLYVYYGSIWVDAFAGGEGQYLPLTGGTVSGSLTVNAVGAGITLKQSATGAATYYVMDNTVESGGKRWRLGYSGVSSVSTFSLLNVTDSVTGFVVDASGNFHVPGGGGIASNEAFGTGALKVNTTGSSNVAVGYQTLNANTTGTSNVAVGYNALVLNTTAGNNTAIGNAALNLNTTGASNTAVGSGALYTNTTGGSNSALGQVAMYSNTTGSSNTGIGSYALFSNTTGYQNVAVGYFSLELNTTGAQNTACGANALLNNIGDNNSAFGTNAIRINSTGYANTASGGNALFGNTTGANNSALGYQALVGNTIGSGNTACGVNSLYNNTQGNYNTAIGNAAGYTALNSAYNCFFGYLAAGSATVSGSYNVVVGANSALSLTSGTQNVFVGYGSGQNLASGSNNIYVGDENIASGAAASNEIVIGQAITGKGSNTAYLKGSSGVYNSANTSTWATTSDQRIKENIKPILDGLSIVNALNPVNFDYKESGKNEDGFIAQEYQTVLPQQIVTHAPNEAEKEWVDEEVLGIQQNLTPFLVRAIQQLSEQNNALEARLAKLEAK